MIQFRPWFCFWFFWCRPLSSLETQMTYNLYYSSMPLNKDDLHSVLSQNASSEIKLTDRSGYAFYLYTVTFSYIKPANKASDRFSYSKKNQTSKILSRIWRYQGATDNLQDVGCSVSGFMVVLFRTTEPWHSVPSTRLWTFVSHLWCFRTFTPPTTLHLYIEPPFQHWALIWQPKSVVWVHLF